MNVMGGFAKPAHQPKKHFKSRGGQGLAPAAVRTARSSSEDKTAQQSLQHPRQQPIQTIGKRLPVALRELCRAAGFDTCAAQVLHEIAC